MPLVVVSVLKHFEAQSNAHFNAIQWPKRPLSSDRMVETSYRSNEEIQPFFFFFLTASDLYPMTNKLYASLK